MTDSAPTSKKPSTADWLFRGLLTKLGDTVDRFTGRRWVPSSSLATSELIERLKKLLDAEARHVPGKGLVIPHQISLRMQWDKFSDDSEQNIDILRENLLTAAADHINDSLYYTLAPLALDVRTDYFTDGVKLAVSFDKFDSDADGVEMNFTIPSMKISDLPKTVKEAEPSNRGYLTASYAVNGNVVNAKIDLPANGRISVGRTAENALVLDDPSVSKTHASIVDVAGSGLAVADTGSTNGTFVNDERLAYGKAVTFGPADRLKFGSIEVVIDRVQPVADAENGPAEIEPSLTTEIDGFEFRNRSSDEPSHSVDTADNAPAESSETPKDEDVVEPMVESDAPPSSNEQGHDKQL